MAIDTAAKRRELEAVLARMGAALSDEPPLRKLVRAFDASGLSRVDAKQAFVLLVELIVATELNQDDIPYVPDDAIDPHILERVRMRVDALVDNIFAGRPLLPT